MTSSRVPSTRPGRPLSGNRDKFHLLANTVIHGDGGLRAVGFDVIEDGVAVGQREEGPLHAHELTLHGLSRFADRGGAPFGEV